MARISHPVEKGLFMNTAKLRSKRVIVTTLAAVTAVGAIAVGGAVWASAANADVQGSERDRVAAAAVQAVGGTAIEVETSDDAGEAYEVEVRKDDGTEVDVALDKDLKVVPEKADD
jgi:outer membrane lipoprotein SlyB